MSRHRDQTDVDLHVPGYIASTDPASTHGTADTTANPGVFSGQFWIEESSTDTPTALKYRDSSNASWITLLSSTIPSLTQGDLLYADSTPELATLGIGSQHDVLTVGGSSAPVWKTGLDMNNIDASISPSWTGTHDFSGGGLTLPTATSPTPTVEGRAVWDTDDDKLRIGDGAATVTLVDEGRTLTGGTNIDAIGDLSQDRTINLSDSIDLAGTLDVTGAVTLDSGFTSSGDGSISQVLTVTGVSPIIRLDETDQTDKNHDIISAGGDLLIRSNNDAFGSATVTLRLDENNNVAVENGTFSSTGAATLDTGANGSSFGGDLTVGGDLNINPTNTYSLTNVATDRTFDADSTSTAELADVLGTLINDLGMDA